MAISKALAELIRVSVGPEMATSAYHYGVEVRQRTWDGNVWVPSRYFRTLAAARKWAKRYAPARISYHGAAGVVVVIAEVDTPLARREAAQAAQADVAIAAFRARTA